MDQIRSFLRRPRRAPSRPAGSWPALAVVALAVASLAGAPVGAQGARAGEGRPIPLSLPAALRLAADRSPDFERVEARYGIERGDLRASGQWPNPTLEYRRENLGSPLLPDEFFTAYIPIDVTGRRVQLLRATRRGDARLAAERNAARRDAELEVARTWVTAVLAGDLAATARAQHDAAAEVAALEAARAREGASSEAASRRTRVEATRLGHQRALAEARAVRERTTLATLLGVPADSLPVLPTLLDEAGLLDAASRTTLADLAARDEAALLAQAQQDRAESRAATLAREEAALRRSVEQRAVLGDWQLQGGSKLTGGFFTGQVGLAVPLPFFNRNAGGRERAAGIARDAEALWRTTVLTIAGEVRAATEQVRRLEAIGPDLAGTIDDADVIASAARVAYAEGHMTLLELLDAQRAAADARATAQQYRADLLLARLVLARAVGAPLVTGVTP